VRSTRAAEAVAELGSLGDYRTDMEFVLSLADALKGLQDPPDPSALRMMASSLLVPSEYQTLRRIVCPECKKHEWETEVRESLVGNRVFDWPFMCPAGDRHHCRCKSCGHSITVTFWFTQ
jgi:hypothetical protein